MNGAVSRKGGKRILVLAGSGEARELVSALAAEFEVVASLAGVTREPLDLGVPTRVGGFGGADGLAAFLRAEKIDVLVDGTHPFATKMTQNAVRAAKEVAIPHVILQRAGWQAGAGDDWRFVDEFEEVAQIIPEGETVFLGTGRQALTAFAGLAGRKLLCRVIDPPGQPFPFAGGQFVVGRPPFSIEEEVAFFKAEGIGWLVVKNAGGARSRSKLDAARILGLPVVMQRRKALPAGHVVETVAACLEWVRGLPEGRSA